MPAIFTACKAPLASSDQNIWSTFDQICCNTVINIAIIKTVIHKLSRFLKIILSFTILAHYLSIHHFNQIFLHVSVQTFNRHVLQNHPIISVRQLSAGREISLVLLFCFICDQNVFRFSEHQHNFFLKIRHSWLKEWTPVRTSGKITTTQPLPGYT